MSSFESSSEPVQRQRWRASRLFWPLRSSLGYLQRHWASVVCVAALGLGTVSTVREVASPTTRHGCSVPFYTRVVPRRGRTPARSFFFPHSPVAPFASSFVSVTWRVESAPCLQRRLWQHYLQPPRSLCEQALGPLESRRTTSTRQRATRRARENPLSNTSSTMLKGQTPAPLTAPPIHLLAVTTTMMRTET